MPVLPSLMNSDLQLTTFIFHLPHNYLSNTLFLFFSFAGAFGFVWVIWLGVAVFKAENQSKTDKFVWLFFATIIAILIINTFTKQSVKRPRPLAAKAHIYQSITKNTLIPTPYPLDYSFPSLHAMTAFGAATILSSRLKRQKGSLFILAILIGFSRVYLGFHYFSDVLAGAFFGWLIAYSFLRFNIFNFNHNS